MTYEAVSIPSLSGLRSNPGCIDPGEQDESQSLLYQGSVLTNNDPKVLVKWRGLNPFFIRAPF